MKLIIFRKFDFQKGKLFKIDHPTYHLSKALFANDYELLQTEPVFMRYFLGVLFFN